MIIGVRNWKKAENGVNFIMRNFEIYILYDVCLGDEIKVAAGLRILISS